MVGAPAFLLSRQAIELGSGRCLNQVHRQVGCTSCEEACPLAAIILTGPRPEIDETLCNRCGALKAACSRQSRATQRTRRFWSVRFTLRQTSLSCLPRA
jgi:heterodisulfide reductase subunit A-like polyferredoxin